MSKRIHDANELLEQEVAKDGDFMDIPYSHGGLGTVQKTCSESYGPDGFPELLENIRRDPRVRAQAPTHLFIC